MAQRPGAGGTCEPGGAAARAHGVEFTARLPKPRLEALLVQVRIGEHGALCGGDAPGADVVHFLPRILDHSGEFITAVARIRYDARMDEIKVPMSPGEMLDKITILRIKSAAHDRPAKAGERAPRTRGAASDTWSLAIRRRRHRGR